MSREQHRAMLVCKMPAACGGCSFLKEILGRYICTASGQASLLNCLEAKYLIVDEEARHGKRHKDCPLLPMPDVTDNQVRAELVIKDLLTDRYGSKCQFCIHNDNPDAGCIKDPGSGCWCEEHAAWNGKIFED